MKMGFVCAAGAWLLLAVGQVQAQSPLAPYVEHEKRLRAAQEVAPLKSELFGDNISLYNGAIEFAVTDIDLPGNNALPVQLRRRFKVESMKEVEPLGGFGVWDLDVPYMYGTFDALYKWNTSANGVAGRCSENWLPNVHSPFTLREVWQGNMLHMPGSGDVEVLVSNLPAPNDGQTYTRAASGFYRFRCKPTMSNGYPGEGFIAVDTAGTKYTFDAGVERGAGVMKMPGAALARTKVFLMASRVEDRFGNWVNYAYSGDKLTAITSSDGRSIAITWSGDTIVKAAANGREWHYAYTGGSNTIGMARFPWLSAVTLPDSSQYTYRYESTSPFGVLNTNYTPLDAEPARCAEPDFDPNSFTLIANHPSGAEGTFYIPYKRLHRSGTPQNACVSVSAENYQLRRADYYDLYSISRKTITGPGLPTLQWTYNYGDLGPARAPCSGGCPTAKTVTVTQPDGTLSRSRFGILYGGNEGRLLGTEVVGADGKVLRSESTTYVSDDQMGAMPFPDQWGTWTGADDDGLALRIRPVQKTTLVQDEVTFTHTINAFDAWTRPVNVTRTNTLNYGRYNRTEATTYHDNTTKWVLGQVRQVTQTHPTTPAVVVSQTDYDAADLPWKRYSFGLLQQTLTYNGDGTLAAVVDGNGNITRLSNWMRGIPQTINYANATTQSAFVDENGWVRSITDENGFITKYGYDAMGRVALVDYPDEDAVNWTSTVSSFAPVGTAEYGLEGGHWKQTVSTGNARQVIYFDAFWRPVVQEQYDAANISETLSQTVKRYDLGGQLAFQSYPLRGLTHYASVNQGAHTFYDALARVTRVEQDSEIGGRLVTKTDYLPNFQTQITSPRNEVTTTTFMAYDQPTTDWPVAIAHPEGAYTDLVRDAFGKPLQVRRHNAENTVALARQYVYDGYQRLCKTIEPETGATVTAYDAAGNLDWSASGLSLTDSASCNQTEAYKSLSRVQRTYDKMNRLVGLAFPRGDGPDNQEGNGNQSWSYWPDGLVRQIDTVNMVDGAPVTVSNAYSYNKRRLLTGESLTQSDSEAWAFGYGYDVYGHLASHTFPSGLSVAYAPNALGQPTRAGAYATDVRYFPNGGMAQFNYGNGVTHTMTQNARGLPERSRDVSASVIAIDDSYDYDAHGNVAAISDARPGNRGNRDMTYDGLDRLTTASSLMFGAAHYTYDVLDNLQQVKVAGRDVSYVYDASNRLTNIMAGGATQTGLGYDTQGNLNNKSGQIFAFDVGNRLRTAPAETYRYDGHGRRFQATHAVRGDIYSLYDQGGVLRHQRNHREAKAIDYITLNGSLVAQISRLSAPAAPIVSAPGFSSGDYIVGWSAVTGAASFNLEESIGGAPWQSLYAGSERSQSISGYGNGAYSYRAQACNTAGCGPWSVPVTVFVQRPPTPPTGITVPADGPSGRYTVSWLPPLVVPLRASSNGPTTYTLEESFNDGTYVAVYSDGTDLSVSFDEKPAGTYAYQVKACNPHGCSTPITGSNPVQVLYPPDTPTLSMPASLLTGSYTVAWSSVDRATRYYLDENFNDGTWVRIHDVTTNSAAVSGRKTGRYGYRVAACNRLLKCSDASTPVYVQVTVPPETAPTGLTAPSSSTNGSYAVNWKGVDTATRYELYESFNGGAFSLVYNGASGSAQRSGRGTGTWTYKVRACNANPVCGPYSGNRSVSVVLPPSVAPGISWSQKSQTDRTPIRLACSVRWTSVAFATRYELWSFGSGQPIRKQYDGAGTSVGTGWDQNVSWYCASQHVVRACNAAGCSGWSAPVAQKVEIVVTGPGGDPW